MANINPEFVNLDGLVYHEKDKVFDSMNRGFLYGDALFETMHAYGSKVQFLNEHLNRLLAGMQFLGMKIPPKFSSHRELLEEELRAIMHRNRAFKGTRIRLTVFRKSGGKYSPTNNDISYLIQVSKLDEEKYTFPETGLKIEIFSKTPKYYTPFNQFKTTNCNVHIQAGIFRNEVAADECLLINQENSIVEAISSNVFFVKNKIILTPSLATGCLNGIIRAKVIQMAAEMKMTIMEPDFIPVNMVETADEIFLTNAVNGIQWVLGYQQIRFYNSTARILSQKLNSLAFN